MLSATLVAPRRFELQERDLPEPGEGEVLVEVQGCGLCASNLGPWEGIRGVGYPMDPGAPGHEVYGTIAGVGSGVGGLSVGDPVTVLSYRGFAEYDLARADAVVKVPPALAGKPVLGEPVACAVNVARRAGVREGDTVVVLGIGFLGALLLRLVRRARPERILAVSRRREGLEMAERLGADEVLTYADDVVGRVGALTDGRMADAVIEVTGKQVPLDLAAELTRVRGRLIIAGYHQDAPRQINLQLWNWRGIDVVNAHERDPAIYTSGMEEAVRLMVADELSVEPLISHTYSLREINRAFDAASTRPKGFFKAVLVPGARS